jgi:hypothetical protein
VSNFDQLIGAYAAGADTLRKSVVGMNHQQLTARPIPGKWTTLECIAHIADFEPVLAERMKRIISHERPLLLVADENLFFTTLAYDHRDLEEELGVIDTTRKQMTRILKSLPKETANKAGIHSFKGLVTLEAVLTSAVNHIPHHVKFIEEKRKALGV